MLKIILILFWSISSEYLIVSGLGSYLFFCAFYNIVQALFLNIRFKFCIYCSSNKKVFEILEGEISLNEKYKWAKMLPLGAVLCSIIKMDMWNSRYI